MEDTHHREEFYFRTIDEEDESNSDSSLNEMDIDDICASIVDTNNSHTLESSGKKVLKDENSNVDIMAQDCDIVNLSDDDENTETIPTEKIVNITNIHITMSENQIRKFPFHENLFDDAIQYLSNKSERFVVNSQSNKGFELQARHLIELLTPNSWLTDTVIQNYMSLLVSYCDNALVINTDLLSCYECRGYRSVHKWFNSIDLIKMDFAFVPINPGKNHWALLIINIWHGSIVYYDSFKGMDVYKELKLVSNFFKEALVDCLLKNSNYTKTVPMQWTSTNGYSPAQSNNTDCGVFTCLNAKHFIFSEEPNFIQEDMNIFRQIIAFELISGNLEPFK